MLHLFDLLKPDDYSRLFSSLNRDRIDRKWLEIFSKFCMQRYLEFDECFFHEKLFSTNRIRSESNSKSILENYTNYLIEYFQKTFSMKYFQAIIKEFEYLNQLKIDQITKQLNENNQLIQKLFLLFHTDDSVIHLSSKPAEITYVNYKAQHMIYLKTPILIANSSRKGFTNKFIADLIHTKSTEIIDESTGQICVLATKDIYFVKTCEANVILPLKLRVLIVDRQTNEYQCGIIGEEAGKHNNFRHLVFFVNHPSILISANYYSPSDIHICFDQNLPYENEFLKNYFRSYPERFMLRVKEQSIIKIRQNDVVQSAFVKQIDCSMMLIEYLQSKQQQWIYRGSPSIEQMNNYYSSQNKSIHHSARQHLSAKKTNAPEIICLNDQTKTKLSRTLDEQFSSFKRMKLPDENYQIVKTMPTRTNHNNLIINSLFLQFAEHFLFYQSRDYQPHICSNRCVSLAEKALKDLPKSINPFLKPIACQWTILETLRIKKARDIRVKYTRPILIYCTPCGKKLTNETQIDQYLYQTRSKLTIELFVFDSLINIRQSYSTEGKILSFDISNGQENVPIMSVNEVDDDQPNPFTYRVERTPVEGVNMTLNEPTMTCCSCTDGCRNRIKCACWLKTLKYAELIGDDRVKSMRDKHQSDADILYQLGYGYRRLHKNVPGGIYECNSRCSCHKETCSNRVVQNGIIAQLQLFKTVGRGWGVRTLHDLPLGTFVSVYSGEIFTSEQADERGKLIGDEYQADLDFFEVNFGREKVLFLRICFFLVRIRI